MFQFLQLRQTFFSLKYLLGCIVLTTVVLFISFRRIRDIFFFQFSSLSISSSAYQLLKRIGGYPLLQSCSSNISRSQGFFCLVWVFMCCIICERICSLIFSAYQGGKFRTVTSSREKSVGESLSLDKSQSNLSLIIVFQSRGISMSIDTSFLSQVSLLRPSLGLLSLSFSLSSFVKGSMMKGRFSSCISSGGFSSLINVQLQTCCLINLYSYIDQDFTNSCFFQLQSSKELNAIDFQSHILNSMICQQYLIFYMGNQGTQNSKILLQAKAEKIIIHRNFQMSLDICGVDTFPHGLDGLRLWQAGIILSRYIIQNAAIFKNKRVLQLGAGVGIAGLTAKKWTQCTEVDITDYHPKVIENIKRNMHKNGISCPAYELDWVKHEANPVQYHIIMGSDIVYFGCPVADLYQIFNEKLMDGGIGIIVIPMRKNYASLFVDRISREKWNFQVQKLQKQQYFESPLQNEAQGTKRYPLLKQIGFEVYKLIKK